MYFTVTSWLHTLSHIFPHFSILHSKNSSKRMACTWYLHLSSYSLLNLVQSGFLPHHYNEALVKAISGLHLTKAMVSFSYSTFYLTLAAFHTVDYVFYLLKHFLSHGFWTPFSIDSPPNPWLFYLSFIFLGAFSSSCSLNIWVT